MATKSSSNEQNFIIPSDQSKLASVASHSHRGEIDKFFLYKF